MNSCNYLWFENPPMFQRLKKGGMFVGAVGEGGCGPGEMSLFEKLIKELEEEQ